MINTISIKSNKDFIRVYKKGRYFAGRYIVLYVLKNVYNMNRLGITASKKTGGSIKRNRLKRLVRENYRLCEGMVKVGYDFVFVIRSSDIMPDFYSMKKEMNYLFKKMNMIIEEKMEYK